MLLTQDSFEKEKYKKDTHTTFQSDDNQQFSLHSPEQHSQKNITSPDNVHSYFEFFLKDSESSPIILSSHPKKNFNEKPSFPEDIQFHQSIKNVKTKISQKQIQKESLQNEFQLDKNNCEFLTNFQKNHAMKLSQVVIKSSRFKRTNEFSNKIIIHEIDPSKHHEVIKMEIHLLWFKTQILILNEIGKSSLKEFGQISDSGSFGNIYFVQFLNQKYCIKNYPFKNQIKNIQKSQQSDDDYTIKLCNSFIATLTQYFFLLLFSQLEIGPKVQTIGGFDIVVYKDSIEFATEICDKLRNDDENLQILKESLLKMHMLQVVHRDIKPSNIMFSQTFKKNVFIDFGGSQVLKETFGEKTMTRFIGTAQYCSDEVFNLLPMKKNYVDLYFNDMYGLKKSILQASSSSFVMDKGKKNIINRIDSTYNILNSERSSDFELIELKHSSFVGDEQAFEFLWRYLKLKYFNSLEEVQKKILQFFKQLKPNDFLRRFYRTEISESTKKLQQFYDLQITFKNESSELLFYLSNNMKKVQSYSKYSSLFRMLSIEFGNLSQQQQQIQISFINKQTIKKSLQFLKSYFQGPISNYSIEDKNFIKLCIITVNFCCISESSFQISLDQKIETSKAVLQIIKKIDKNSLQKLKIVFVCTENSLSEICTFYQYFLFNVFHLIPSKYKSEMVIKTVSSLCLLGLPISSQNKSHKAILHKILTSDSVSQSQKNKDLKKSEQEYRIEKIVLFWECKILLLLFQNVFYNKKQTEQQQNIEEVNYTTFWEKELEIMVPKGNQKSAFFNLNQIFYIRIFRKYSEFDEKSCEELLQILISPQVHQMQSSSKLICKWKKLMCVILCYFSNAYKITKSTQIKKLIQKQRIFESSHNKTILPYLIFFYCDEISQMHVHSHFILKKIDEIINQTKISFRFQLQRRLIIALQRRNFNKLRDILSIIKKEVDLDSALQKNILFVSKFLHIISHFFEEYLTDSPDFNRQSQQIVSKIRDVVIIAMEIGMRYFQKKSDQGKINTFEALQFGEFDMMEFQKQITIRRFMETFASTLIFIGKIFDEVSNLALQNKKQMTRKQQITTEEIRLPQIYDTFLVQLKSNRIIFDYIQIWMDLIQYDQQFRQKVKSNRVISMIFVTLFLQKRRNNDEILRTNKVIEMLFDKIRAQQFQCDMDSNKPNFLIAFDFFQVKLMETNYGLHWCHQIIKMHEICAKNNLLQRNMRLQQSIRMVFNSFIYTQKTYSEIQSLLWSFTEILKKVPSRKLVQQIKKAFEVIFWCNCYDCFPRKAANWRSQKFTEYLFTTLDYLKVKQNPYMSLVYFYNMKNRILEVKYRKKFTVFILKSIPFLTYDVKDVIFPELYEHIYAAIQPYPFAMILDSRMNPELLKIPKVKYQHRNQKLIRKYFYLCGQFRKNQKSDINTLDELAEKRLVREYCMIGYQLPALIRKNFLIKLRRYHEVKENYKKTQKITEIGKSKRYFLHCH